MTNIFIVLAILVALVAIVLSATHDENLMTIMRARHQPCTEMSQWVLEHAYVKKNPLDETIFKGTRGCLCIFRDCDIETVFEDPLLAPLFPHFQELRDANTVLCTRSNAFVMNILVNVAAKNGVGWHIDNTIEQAFDDDMPRIAEAVGVLYIAAGGRRSSGGVFKIKDGYRAETFVPCTGDIMVFPGRCDHKVTPLKKGMAPRISLVVESYRLCDADHAALTPQTPRYTLIDNQN